MNYVQICRYAMVISSLTRVYTVLLKADLWNTLKLLLPNAASAKVKNIVISESVRPSLFSTCTTTRQIQLNYYSNIFNFCFGKCKTNKKSF